MAIGIIARLGKSAQRTITKIGVPMVFSQGNRVIQLAKKMEIQSVAAIKIGSWLKVMGKNTETFLNQTGMWLKLVFWSDQADSMWHPL
jgi:hypothetical protein